MTIDTGEPAVAPIQLRIRGTPYGRWKSRGDLAAPGQWKQDIVAQTRALPKISEACILQVTFLLPPEKFPADLPHGPDLDNLLKLLLDALKQTIFSSAAGGDSCVVALSATKARVADSEQAGANIEIVPVSGWWRG